MTAKAASARFPRLPRRLTSLVLFFVAILLVAVVRYSPPAPLGLDAPADAFSAARARETQRVLSESGQPRPPGSEANANARAWLEAELAKSGFRTELQTATACSRHAACGRVVNVVATRPGTEPAAASVLLMAHYDSVPCSPGASDDGMGTATVIETARALAASAPLRRTVVIVLTDGEEAGLLGAEAFVREHPLAATVHGAVNIDARGSSGPSAMFETSPGNGWIVGLYARRAKHPVSSSLFYEIYKRMPNDTDFTSVKSRVHGVNLANVGRIEHYHTPLDSFENADPGTLQHHGDQALAMVRALADAGPELDVALPAPGAAADATRDAVWFDVMASFVVRWPAAASLGFALLALALVVLSAIRLRAWGFGLIAAAASLAAALVAALAVGLLLRWGGALAVPWVAHPLPALLSLHCACIAAGLGAARLVGRNATPAVLWAGTWLTWAALGVVTAVLAPGACFLFVVPSLVAGLVSLLPIDLATAVPALVGAVLWMPIAVLAYDGLGLAVPVLACVTSIVLVSTLPALAVTRRNADANANANADADANENADANANADARAPMSPRAWSTSALVVTAPVLALVVAAVLVPPFSAETPQRVNVVFRQDDARDDSTPPARVFVEASWGPMPWGKAPAAMVAALGDPARVRTGATTPWSAPVPFVDVPRVTSVALEPPRAEVLSSTTSARGWMVNARLSSPRGARTIALVLPAGRATVVTVAGLQAIPRNDMVILRGVPAEGLEVVLHAAGRTPIALTVFDVTPGLPPADVAPVAHAVLDARDARAVPTQEGDVTIVARHAEL